MKMAVNRLGKHLWILCRAFVSTLTTLLSVIGVGNILKCFAVAWKFMKAT